MNLLLRQTNSKKKQKNYKVCGELTTPLNQKGLTKQKGGKMNDEVERLKVLLILASLLFLLWCLLWRMGVIIWN